jgi:ACS family tartrate transporter-like MFS transporter
MKNEQSALHQAGEVDRLSAQESVGERTRRRVTRRLMPFLIGAYLLAYIDRANLGIAKLQMQGDLGFTDAIIGFGAGIFFIGYFLLEIPGSLIVERWSARKWFARIMISWGLVAALTGFITTPNQFYLSRFALGAAEAGFFPGVIVYLSHWFRYEDRTRAKSWFMMTQPLSVVIGTPVSRWILENVHWYGLDGWRWVFLLEGIPSVVCGVIALYYLPDRVPDARWLHEDEKSWLIGELNEEARDRTAAGRTRILDAFRQPQTMLLIVVFFLVVTGNQAILFFLPSITENMKGISITWRTALIVLPYLCSMAGILLNGFWSNRTGERRWHTAVPILITAAALACAILAGDRLAIVVVCLALLGFCFQAYLPPFWTLPTAYLGKSAAATAIGTINSFGNLGGFVGPYIFGYLSAATGHFQTGLWFLTGCMLTSGLLATRIHVGNTKRINEENT